MHMQPENLGDHWLLQAKHKMEFDVPTYVIQLVNL
jgi:hypothetical protein